MVTMSSRGDDEACADNDIGSTWQHGVAEAGVVSGQSGAVLLEPAGPARSKTKRLLDVVLSSSALLFLLPLLLLTALVIAIDNNGSVIFRQRRTGLGGKVFVIYKFRTMRTVDDGPDVRHAIRNDGRVTRVGAFLRQTSIDELPQLINVLKGDMSLVGPRPHAVAHDTRYRVLLPGYCYRFRARPGLTGLAQISGCRGEIRSTACMERRILADNEYIENWSLRLDFVIIARTLPRLWRDFEAY